MEFHGVDSRVSHLLCRHGRAIDRLCHGIEEVWELHPSTSTVNFRLADRVGPDRLPPRRTSPFSVGIGGLRASLTVECTLEWHQVFCPKQKLRYAGRHVPSAVTSEDEVETEFDVDVADAPRVLVTP